ncbi:MAG: hypothetical protein K940chlam8_00351 [Chlamydiae bacterium]|nr:hypothetical protein [Chlamydiota bacterium]
MSIQEFLDQSNEQLEVQEQELLKEIYQFKIEQKLQQKIGAAHLIKQKKKMRSRILTALRQKEMQGEKDVK